MMVQFPPHSEHTAAPLQIQTVDVKIAIGRSSPCSTSHNTVHLTSRHCFHFPAIYPSSSISLPDGRTETAWEPSVLENVLYHPPRNIYFSYVGSNILAAEIMRMNVFCRVTPCNVVYKAWRILEYDNLN
jgi:hypothetical protein